jgi:hypothetical protein
MRSRQMDVQETTASIPGRLRRTGVASLHPRPVPVQAVVARA